MHNIYELFRIFAASKAKNVEKGFNFLIYNL